MLVRDAHTSSGDWSPEQASGLVVARGWCGASFGGGLIRFHDAHSGPIARDNICAAFGLSPDEVGWVAFDWLGRQIGFVIPEGMGVDVTMAVVADIGMGRLATAGGAEAFLDGVQSGTIADNLNQSAFAEFLAFARVGRLNFDQCVGFKHPPFLGGGGELSNLEVSDLDVYWTLMGQLYARMAPEPDGARVSSVSVNGPRTKGFGR